jgi:hypothetical protein
VEKLLKQWLRAVAAENFHEARAFCAPNGLRRQALHEARMARQQAQRLARTIRRRYAIDPYEKLRNGEIK